jgi:hypothetical protein
MEDRGNLMIWIPRVVLICLLIELLCDDVFHLRLCDSLKLMESIPERGCAGIKAKVRFSATPSARPPEALE